MSRNDQFDEAIDRLVEGKSPKQSAVDLSDEERRMLQMAQMIAGAGKALPSSDFRANLGNLVRSPRGGMSRRTAMLSGLGALAAGVGAGFGLGHGLTQTTGENYLADDTDLVENNGYWSNVAMLSELPEGAVKSFKSGALAGFLVHRDGKIIGLSGVCTHMGCLLNYSANKERLVCPCHGAEFALSGTLRSYPRHLTTKLPGLPRIKVRVEGQSVQVWTV